MPTTYAATLKKAEVKYGADITALKKVLPDLSKTDVDTGDLSKLFKTLDKTRDYFPVLAAIEAVLKCGDRAKLDLRLTAVTKQINEATAKAAKAAKKTKTAFGEGTEAAETCRDSVHAIFSAVEKQKARLLSAASSNQPVAFVPLLPMDVTVSLKSFDRKKLARYVVQVEMSLPKPVLNALARGVEGISLATMQDVAGKAVAPFRTKAMFELEFLDLNIDEFTESASMTEATLKTLMDSAAGAAVTAINAHWGLLEKAHAELKAMNKKAAQTIVLGSLGLLSSIATAVVSFGTAVPAYISMAKTIASIAASIMTLTKSADSAAEDVMERVLELREDLDDGIEETAGVKTQAANVLDILGMPFMKGCASAEASISVLKAKCAGLGSEAEDLLEQVNAGMKVLEVMAKLPKKETQAQVVKLKKASTEMLDKVGVLMKGQGEYIELAAAATKVVAELKQAKLPKMAALSAKVELGSKAAAVVGAASSLMTIASALV